MTCTGARLAAFFAMNSQHSVPRDVRRSSHVAMPRSRNRPGFRFSSCRLLIVSAICAIIFAVIAVSFRTVNAVLTNLQEAYAVDWTSEFVIRHLGSTGNTWPTDWSDLEDEFESEAGHADQFTFEELQELVNIRWDTNAAAIANSDPPLKVITLTSASESHFVGSEPNERILNYLADALSTTADSPK